MKTLHNEQYTRFILSEVVRPYQNILFGDMPHTRIETLVFRITQKETEFNYWDLVDDVLKYEEWFKMVVDRISKCYSCIDFSFFPNDPFANILKAHLRANGVKRSSQWD